ncbi:hypothetical protein B0T20DRAFT_395161 [Sordaria brevicollis]|uniref:Transmembrane protein n=1 Tax=Sordaria brevicollis TaxID=83679 RepID=A0AAE0PB77_SORBR|nr:hypothetical protein B0T20DRAFT_395161 [Sordaria brevicollis]
MRTRIIPRMLLLAFLGVSVAAIITPPIPREYRILARDDSSSEPAVTRGLHGRDEVSPVTNTLTGTPRYLGRGRSYDDFDQRHAKDVTSSLRARDTHQGESDPTLDVDHKLRNSNKRDVLYDAETTHSPPTARENGTRDGRDPQKEETGDTPSKRGVLAVQIMFVTFVVVAVVGLLWTCLKDGCAGGGNSLIEASFTARFGARISHVS